MSTTLRPEATVESPPEPADSAQLIIDLPPTVRQAVERVLNETGDRPGAMFGKALGLYILALKARSRGEHVGSARSTDALETEFTGF